MRERPAPGRGMDERRPHAHRGVERTPRNRAADDRTDPHREADGESGNEFPAVLGCVAVFRTTRARANVNRISTSQAARVVACGAGAGAKV